MHLLSGLIDSSSLNTTMKVIQEMMMKIEEEIKSISKENAILKNKVEEPENDITTLKSRVQWFEIDHKNNKDGIK